MYKNRSLGLDVIYEGSDTLAQYLRNHHIENQGFNKRGRMVVAFWDGRRQNSSASKCLGLEAYLFRFRLERLNQFLYSLFHVGSN